MNQVENWLTDFLTRRKEANAGDYLVVERVAGKAPKYHLPVKKDGKPDRALAAAAWAALFSPGGHRGQPYAGPDKAKTQAKLRALYKAQKWPLPGGDKAKSLDTGQSLSVIKQADGKWRWVLGSSNSFRDDQKEIISQKALEADVARADKEKDFGPLLWWHLDGQKDKDGNDRPMVKIGQCDFNAIHNHSLLESGTFDDPRVAQAVAEHASDLQVSIGFMYPETEPDGEGVFHHIRRYERSLLPAGSAANPLTGVPVVTKGDAAMQEDKLKALKALVGDDAAAAAIQSIEQSEQKAIAQRRAQKDAGGDDDETAEKEEGAEGTGETDTIGGITPEAFQSVVHKAIEGHMALHMAQYHGDPVAPAKSKELDAVNEAVKAIKESTEKQNHILAALEVVQKAEKENSAKLARLNGDLPPGVLRRLAASEQESNVLSEEQMEALRQKGVLPHDEDPNVKSFGDFLNFATAGGMKAPPA